MNASCQRQFLREGSLRSTGVFLAAFGKHPAWNDHIDDLGFDTDTLAQAKKMIYVDGISSQIDSGAWERLRPEARFPRFDHGFVWHRGGEVVLGGLCESRDGKGRSRYPMSVCLHAIGVPLAQVARELSPVLERALSDCRRAATADQVRATLARARATLRGLALRPMATSDATTLPRPPQGIGSNAEGPARILYQLRSQFTAWAPGRSGCSEDGVDARAAHMRVPQASNSGRYDWLAWLLFLRSQLAADAPLLLMWPRSANWLDVVAGIPNAADFFTLKANSQTVPLASDVPYQMDASFRAKANAVLTDTDAEGTPVRSIFSISLENQPSCAANGIPLRREEAAFNRTQISCPRSRGSRVAIAVALGVALVLAGAAGYVFVRDLPMSWRNDAPRQN